MTAARRATNAPTKEAERVEAAPSTMIGEVAVGDGPVAVGLFVP